MGCSLPIAIRRERIAMVLDKEASASMAIYVNRSSVEFKPLDSLLRLLKMLGSSHRWRRQTQNLLLAIAIHYFLWPPTFLRPHPILFDVGKVGSNFLILLQELPGPRVAI